MEQTRYSGRETQMSSNSAQEIAEKIVRDAESREPRSPDAHHGRAQVRETSSSYLGMTRKEALPISGGEPVLAPAPSSPPFLSPVRDDSAPLPSALGIPTLVKDTELAPEDIERREAGRSNFDLRSSENDRAKEGADAGKDSDVYVSSGLGLPLLSENPAPLSSALHIPTLINESKSSSRR